MSRDTLKVNGICCKVKHRVRVFCGRERVAGLWIFAKREIRITKASPFEQFDTEWHEALHAITDIYNIGLTHEQLRKLTGAIVQVLIENPWLGKPAEGE